MAHDSSYGRKPLYYGASKKSPIYYGSSNAPVYYGSGGGNAPYYYGSGRQGNSGGDDNLVGTITIGRIVRVVAQRWISVLVFLLIGLVTAFAIYRISPEVYEAKSGFTMDMHHPAQSGNGIGQIDMPDYGSTYAEIFNTRITDWRSEKIINMIVQQYRKDHLDSNVTDAEIIGILGGSQLELVRNSRLITISVRASAKSSSSEDMTQARNIAAALANAYSKAIEKFTDEENKLRCDKAVTQIHEQVEKQRRKVDSDAKNLLDFRTANKLDFLRSQRETYQQGLTRSSASLLDLDEQVTAAKEWVKVLEAVQETPEEFGALPTAVPRSTEIGTAYSALQLAKSELSAMLITLTPNHPSVQEKQKIINVQETQFKEAVQRALQTANGNLMALKNQLAVAEKNRDEFRKNLSDIDLKIVAAESGLQQRERETEVSDALYKDLLQKENEARILAEQNNEIVRHMMDATPPSKPVLPNPTVIFAAGIILSLGLGLLFVLMLDHLEDTIVSLSDIETRLSLKVLAVLPHVRRKKREQVAKYIFENKYSQFAEAVAGLRNLLDSPRYQGTSQVLLTMSTQPGEGKTIASCSIAISSAQAGKRTLLVDFDLRRPRVGRIWKMEITKDKSFSHALQRMDGVDFSKIVMKSEVENLDLMCSLQPEGVNPSSIMGSHVVADFFAWARQNYDRIIIDSPPYGLVGDVMTLASMVDGVIMMCCPDRTHFKPLQHASRNLTEAGATILGVLVNDVELGGSGSAFTPASTSYGYSKYGYGYRSYGYSPSKYAPYEPYGAYSPYGPYAPAGRRGKKGKDGKDVKSEKDGKKVEEQKQTPPENDKATPPSENSDSERPAEDKGENLHGISDEA